MPSATAGVQAHMMPQSSVCVLFERQGNTGKIAPRYPLEHIMSADLVSIGMPVYNGERFLEEAILSNLRQTHQNIELVISDNASNDATEEICRSFAASDDRVSYVRNETNLGAAGNYNLLVDLANGDYFRWANADDVVAPALIERTLPILQSRSDVVIAYGKTCLIDADGSVLREYDDNLNLESESAYDRYRQFKQSVGLTNVIYGLMRTAAVRQTDRMGSGQLPAGDVSFMASMTLLGKFVEVPETLFFRRIHEGAFSSLNNSEDEKQFWTGSEDGKHKAVAIRSRFADSKMIWRSPLSIKEKLFLLSFTAKDLYWHRSEVANDILGLLAFDRRNR